MRVLDLTSPRAPQEDADILGLIDAAPEPVLAIHRVYPAGWRIAAHRHAKTQLWCARRGVVVVSMAERRWMLPPGHGLIIPAGVVHASEMLSRVEMRSIYVEAGAFDAAAPRVVEITALAGDLIRALVEETQPALSGRRLGLITALLLDELGRLPERPLGLPFPADPRLAALCRSFLGGPKAKACIDGWAQALGMSRRSFTRLFRAETGVSFMTWRQQACVFAALPRLAAGESVTSVALEAGYDDLAAFTTMFRRMMGGPPSRYARKSGAFAA